MMMIAKSWSLVVEFRKGSFAGWGMSEAGHEPRRLKKKYRGSLRETVANSLTGVTVEHVEK